MTSHTTKGVYYFGFAYSEPYKFFEYSNYSYFALVFKLHSV